MRNTSKYLIAYTVLLASMLCASNPFEDAAQTPNRFAAASLEPTPGTQLRDLQMRALTKDSFDTVFGEKLVDNWGVNWSVFQEQTLSFEAPQIRQNLKKLFDNLSKANRSSDEQLVLYGRVAGIKQQIEVVHAERLNDIAKAYFKMFFPSANITSDSKLDGVQLGARINVVKPDSSILTYHVKTHSDGRLASKSTAAKRVNVQELLAYRTLEYLGVGCEVHFFARSAEDVYIATLDANTFGSFELFEKISGTKWTGSDAEYIQDIAGALANIESDPRKLTSDILAEIENTIEHDSSAQNFLKQMSTLDIITRILKLHDLLNNSANFGFVKSSNKPASIKVIDFRVMDDVQLKMDHENWGSFLEGNGHYRYVGSHKTMRYALHDRSENARVITARQLMSDKLKNDLERASRLAYRDVKQFTQTNIFTAEQANIAQNLTEYYQAIVENIDFFAKKLKEWVYKESAGARRERDQ